ncbi:MAG: DUF190 domain-containing protein [Chitinophagales bacterium]|nr:DUF190 domain-containing protein [Chitinophagales bacterium]MDW8428350.1 DUF190 domain-containing protein [Chitinophagales bacterium]
MNNQQTRAACLLRIFLGESDQYHGQPLHELIVKEARRRGLSGATVLRGIMGFGANSRVIHSAKWLELSSDLPLVVEIVDLEANVRDFAAWAEDLFERSGAGGLVTLEKAEVIRYQPGKKEK